MADKEKPNFKVVADNRRARFDYEIGETFEAGMMLTGPEVKSLRTGKATVAESYAAVDRNGEVILYNANIPEYLQANRFNHEPKRPRKLLLHAKEIAKLAKGVEREGMTIVPLQDLLQREGPRQDRHRARTRQEAARQARDREDARLEPRQVAAHARAGVRLEGVGGQSRSEGGRNGLAALARASVEWRTPSLCEARSDEAIPRPQARGMHRLAFGSQGRRDCYRDFRSQPPQRPSSLDRFARAHAGVRDDDIGVDHNRIMASRCSRGSGRCDWSFGP